MVKVNDLPNDGLLVFGNVKTTRDQNGKKTGEVFENQQKLFFNFVSIRQSDTTYFDSIGKTVDLKVKTYYIHGVETTSLKVLIDGTMYEVTMIDPDTQREYMYWYLTKVGVADGF